MTFGSSRGDCARTDVYQIRRYAARAHAFGRPPSSMYRRRGNANGVPVYFSVGFTAIDIGHCYHRCLISFYLSVSPSFSFSFIFFRLFSAETYNYSFGLQRGRIRETRRLAACSRDRRLVFRSFSSGAILTLLARRLLPLFVIYCVVNVRYKRRKQLGARTFASCV